MTKKLPFYIFMVLIIFLFIIILYNEIFHGYFDNDYWWYLPTVARFAEKLSFRDLLKYLLYPELRGTSGLHKAYTYLNLNLFGPQVKFFISVSLCFHFISAFLIFKICKILKFDFLVCLFSSLTYLVLFTHFHAYMWPMAFQHLGNVFFTLLVLYLYLKTNAYLEKSHKKYYIFLSLTFGINVLATFCRLNIIVLPVLILGHILFCSQNNQKILQGYTTWLPLFLTYLGYPLFTLCKIGDDRLQIYLFTKYSYFKLVIIGIVLILGFRLILQIYLKYQYCFLNFIKQRVFIVCVFFSLFLVVLGWPRVVLLFYNFIVPLLGLTNSFLDPLNNVLFNQVSFTATHYIPIHVSFFNILCVLIMLILFFREFIFKQHRGVIIFFIWYCISFLFLNHENPIRSRYFIYISPFFSIMVSATLIYILDIVLCWLKVRQINKQIIICLIFLCIYVPNLFGIKYALLKRRLMNSYYIYDYIKIAALIKDDLMKKKVTNNIDPKNIYIQNIMLTDFRELLSSFPEINYFPMLDVYRDYNFRCVLAQVFNDNRMFYINVNTRSAMLNAKDFYYSINNFEIRNGDRFIEDPMVYFFKKAMIELNAKNYLEAKFFLEESFKKNIYVAVL